MWRYRILAWTVMALCARSWNAEAAVKIVASTPDLAYFAKQVGGDLVEVESIAKPTADVHYVEVRPSYMLKVSRADLAVTVGLELDLWMDRIIDGSRNSRLSVVDCSKYIHPLEVPTFKADARYGDLHRFGNPHYWLTPDNAAPITQAILEGLSASDPGHAEQFGANRDRFLARLDSALPALEERAAPLAEEPIISYHSSWAYFNAFTGMVVAGHIEPYPGVTPSPSHVAELIDLIRKRGIRIIAIEPYFDRRVPDRIASETGARVVTLYPSIGGRKAGESYIEFLQGNVDALCGALP